MQISSIMEIFKFLKSDKPTEFVDYPANPNIKIPVVFANVEEYWAFLEQSVADFGVEPQFSFTIDSGKIYVNQADLITQKSQVETNYTSLGETTAGESQTFEIDDLPLAVVVGQGLFYIAKNYDDSILLYQPDSSDTQVKLFQGHSAMVGSMENKSPNSLKLSQNYVEPNHLMVKYSGNEIQILDTSSPLYCQTRYYSYSHNKRSNHLDGD
jgi:hypothetical protein